MLLSPFTSPRRLAILTVLVFLAIVVLVRNSTYSEYLPSYDLPSFSNGKVPQDTTTGSKSFGEDAPAQDTTKQDLWHEYKPAEDKTHVTEPAAEEEYEEKPKVIAVDHTSTSSHSSSASSSTSHSTSATTAASESDKASISPIEHSSYSEIQEKIKEFIQWDRPDTPGHWPGYGDYVNKDYDPNRWEGLPM